MDSALMKKVLLILFLLVGCGGSSANMMVVTTTHAPTVVAGCQYGTGLSDGCPAAPAGSVQYPNLLDTQKVTALNIITGSGYTDGTYTWTTSGGGGSGATGNITVVAGKLGGAYGQSYTISNRGSGYTGKPTIIFSAGGGSGAVVTATVYQATPHNAGTTWNVAGVDYHVGIPSGTTLKDPTTASLPSGATLSGTRITITGCGVTLDGYDFTLHNTAVDVNVAASGCTTTIQNSKQHAFSNPYHADGGTIAHVVAGSGGTFLYQNNEYDGVAPYPLSGGSGFSVNDPIQHTNVNSETIILRYNYFHNFDAKIVQMSGTTPASNLIEQYNLFSDFGACGTTCAHGEAEYAYSAGGTLTWTVQFNTYLLEFYSNAVSNLTSPLAAQADRLTIDGVAVDHNVVLVPGPGDDCPEVTIDQYGNPDRAGVTFSFQASRAIYDGAQNDGGTASIQNGVFGYNYIDASGSWWAWTPAGSKGTVSGISWTGNVDAGTGGNCNSHYP